MAEEDDEWVDDPKVVFVDMPELHKADAEVALQQIQLKNWGSREASLVLNDRFEMRLVPETATGTQCLFSVNPAEGGRVTFIDHVEDYWGAQIVAKDPKENTEILTFPLNQGTPQPRTCQPK